MTIQNSRSNDSSLFNTTSKDLNFTSTSSDDISQIIKDLNIVNPDDLSKNDLSIILKRIDDYGGLYTTQQLENIDYSKFNNHVFFDSAVNKVTYAFDRILNIPFDQDELENIKYKNKTDGYTNYVLKNNFPSSKGYLNFSGVETVVIYDEQGKILNTNKTNKIGLLNPKRSSFSFDFWLKPNGSSLSNSNNQVVFSKVEVINNNNVNSIKNGFVCITSDIDNDNEMCYLSFSIYIEGNLLSSKTKIKKDEFQNIVISVSSSKNNKIIDFLTNGNIVDRDNIISEGSLQNKSFGEGFKERNINFSIGGVFASLNSNVLLSTNITHKSSLLNNFRGEIDEFRFFHKTRSQKNIKKSMHKNIFSQKGLLLYLRFNEPKGNYRNSCLLIDHSGNKLHGIVYQNVNNQISILTDTSNFKVNEDVPLKLEKKEDSPVLNPSYTETITNRSNLIDVAKEYDSQNPNLIFNLMPRHYFLSAADFQNLPVFSSQDAYSLPDSIVDNNGNLVKTGSLNATVPANNELVNIVLIWARFFDQLKCYISSITNLTNVNYDAINEKKIVGMQIPLMCKMYGIEFKEIFPTITKSKLDNENLNFEDIISELSIRKIQNILWQRFLINTQDFLRSKGTIKSIKSVFSSFGIDHEKYVDIKEYSSNNNIVQNNNYTLNNVKKFAIDFGNSVNISEIPDFTSNIYADNKLYLEVQNIQSKLNDQSRVDDTIEDGIGQDWSIEMFFNFKDLINKKEFLQKRKINQDFERKQIFNNEQYLFRIDNSNNDNMITVHYVRKNVNNTKTGNIIVKIKTVHNSLDYNQEILIENVDLFSSKKYFSITQKVINNKVYYNAYIDDVGSKIEIKDLIKKQSITAGIPDLTQLFSRQSNLTFKIGDYNYTNQTNFIQSNINPVFQGQIYKVRIWKKALLEKEIKSHIKNIDNYGTINADSKKFIISDFEVKNIQSTYNSETNVREWSIEDKSNNLKNVTVDNVLSKQFVNTMKLITKNTNQVDNNVISFDNFLSKVDNIKFDEVNSYNKFNIVSYKNDLNKNLTDNYNSFPSNEMPKDFVYGNVNRLSIDMSVVKIVNDDISKIISDINSFTSKISNSYSRYEYNYQEIEEIRKNYFDKFSDSNFINYSSIGNIFKYFDNILSSLLYDIVPSRVRFEGFNLVYESHVLERHKYVYKNKNSNVPINNPLNKVDFSREFKNSRRDFSYNNNRKQTLN